MPDLLPPKHSQLLLILIFSLALQLTGCSATGKSPAKGLSAAEYRQQAYHSIDQKRYADGAKLLQAAITLEPSATDYLLLGDIQETRQKYQSARSSYQQGLNLNTDDKTKRLLVFHWATLEALEFNNLEKTTKLTIQLAENSPATLNLKALQAMALNHFEKALDLTEQVTGGSADQEMKGWAHYHAARSWIAVGNQNKAFQSLFFAVNHARGHGLVDRITRLWEELKQQPQQQ